MTGVEEGTSVLFQYGALGVWAAAATGACFYLVKQLVKAKQEHINDKDTWAKEQREDYQEQQGVLRQLADAHGEVAKTAEASRSASVGSIKRIDALADAIPNVDKLTYQAGKNA